MWLLRKISLIKKNNIIKKIKNIKKMITTKQIKDKIEKELSGAEVEVYDKSAEHAEHNVTGGHFAVKVSYNGFKGKNMIEQHQMIYKILEEEMKEEVHALQLTTREN